MRTGTLSDLFTAISQYLSQSSMNEWMGGWMDGWVNGVLISSLVSVPTETRPNFLILGAVGYLYLRKYLPKNVWMSFCKNKHILTNMFFFSTNLYRIMSETCDKYGNICPNNTAACTKIWHCRMEPLESGSFPEWELEIALGWCTSLNLAYEMRFECCCFKVHFVWEFDIQSHTSPSLCVSS